MNFSRTVDFMTNGARPSQDLAMSKMLLLSGMFLLSAGLLACGALAPTIGALGGDGPADGGADAHDGGGAAPSSVPGSAGVPGTCTLRVNGESVTDAPAVASPSAMLQGTKLLIQCSYDTKPMGWGSITVYVDGVVGPGTYQGDNAYYEAYDGIDTPTGYSSHEPQAGVNHPCTVVVDAFAPREKGGMTARFSCPLLTSNLDSVSAEGSVALPPRAGNDAGAPPDAGGLNEAGAPSCVMSLHGQYEAEAVGNGDNFHCSAYASDGTSFSYSPGGTMGYVGVGAAWCPTCGIDYTGSGCSYHVELDEGVNGRYVASFSCTGLVGGDGTTESVTGRIDGIHVRPPE